MVKVKLSADEYDLDVCLEKKRINVFRKVRLRNTLEGSPSESAFCKVAPKKRDPPSHGNAHGLRCRATTFLTFFPQDASHASRSAIDAKKKKKNPLSIRLRVCLCLPSASSNPPTAVNPHNLRSTAAAAKPGMTGKWKGRFEKSRPRLYVAAEALPVDGGVRSHFCGTGDAFR